MENSNWKTAAIISMVVAAVFIILSINLFYSKENLNNEWAYEYEILGDGWCEWSNDMGDIYNTQLDWLIYYDSESWEEDEYMEMIDCYDY